MVTNKIKATFSVGHRLKRYIWQLVWVVFASWTPPQMCRWRHFLLRLFGANLEWPCDVRGTARIWWPANLRMAKWSIISEGVDCYNVGTITLERGAIVSQRSFLCTASHNIRSSDHDLVVTEIVIGEEAWVAAEAFIGPGVAIGAGAVVSARAVCFEDVESWDIVRGNPARVIGKRQSLSFEYPSV